MNFREKGWYVLLSTSFLLPFTFFLFPLEAKPLPLTDKTWVIIRPVQCLGNRWEKDWLAKSGHKAAAYPIKQEKDILKSYFAKKGVSILESRTQQYVQGDPLCQACDCPRGDTFYLLIHAVDAPKMVKLGYTERVPANLVPPTK